MLEQSHAEYERVFNNDFIFFKGVLQDGQDSVLLP